MCPLQQWRCHWSHLMTMSHYSGRIFHFVLSHWDLLEEFSPQIPNLGHVVPKKFSNGKLWREKILMELYPTHMVHVQTRNQTQLVTRSVTLGTVFLSEWWNLHHFKLPNQDAMPFPKSWCNQAVSNLVQGIARAAVCNPNLLDDSS